jgi:hypothetical protein
MASIVLEDNKKYFLALVGLSTILIASPRENHPCYEVLHYYFSFLSYQLME